MAKQLKELLAKHANRLQVELGRITHPAEYTRSAIPYATPTIPAAAHHHPVAQVAASAPAAYNAAARIPMTGVLANMQAEAATTTTPTPNAATVPAAVPIVVEPPSTAVSAAPSPASAPANKRAC